MSEYSVNGTQVFSRIEYVDPIDPPPLPNVPRKAIIYKTKIDQVGYRLSQSEVVGEVSETWENTRTTVDRTRSVKAINGTVNPEILAVQKAVLVVNDATTPTASIGIEADITGDAGTYYGMNLFNNNDTDFSVTSTFPYEGSVVFRQEGVGSDLTTTSIKQGTITLTDPDAPLTTTFTASTLTSGVDSATWADIIAGGGGSGNLESVLTNGNTATGADASINLFADAPDTFESHLTSTELNFTDGTDTTTINQAGITTTADLTLDIGADLILNGTITETTAGGFTGQYLKIIINGISYKLQLLAD